MTEEQTSGWFFTGSVLVFLAIVGLTWGWSAFLIALAGCLFSVGATFFFMYHYTIIHPEEQHDCH